MKSITFITACIFLVTGFVATAQTDKEEIVTDRPDQTESPALVPRGAVQVETGFFLEHDEINNINFTNVAFNTTLLKYGVNSNLELRFIAEYLGEYITDGEVQIENSDGFSPVAFGVKLKLADERNFWPQAGLISHVVLKSGYEKFSPTYTAANFRFTFAHTLSDDWSLSYNLGVEWDGETPQATFLYTLSLSYLITDKIACFGESYSFLPESGKPDHRIDGGLTYKLNPVLQLDLSSGIGLNENAPDYFVSTGVSFRLFQ